MNEYVAEIVVSNRGPVVGRLFQTVWSTNPTEALLIAGCLAAAMRVASSMYDFGVTNVVAKDVSK